MTTREPPPIAAEKAQVLLKTIWNIAGLWQLTPDQEAALLGVDAVTAECWRAQPELATLSISTLERVACVLNIYAQLQVLLPIQQRADVWVHQPNSAPLFGGGTALQKMLQASNAGLRSVSGYLDVQVQGWGARGGDEEVS